MKALLICPAERPAVAFLAEPAPLALVPVLGRRLLDCWLSHLASQRVTHVFVLAADRPEQVRAHVGDGARWGLRVDVRTEPRELTPSEARCRYRADDASDWLAAPEDVRVMDHLPGLPEHPLFDSYGNWMAALIAWIPNALTPDRVGVRELKPGVWAGLHTRVSPLAELRPPCWLGEDVCVGPQAVIGPQAVVEDRGVVEAGAEIAESVVAPETLVGELTEIRHSLARGDTLLNWKNGSRVQVPDPFLLCSLTRRRSAPGAASWLGRLAALALLMLTAPFAWAVMWRARSLGRSPLREQTAVRPCGSSTGPGETLVYYELREARGAFRRWPQLWNVVCGDFAWIGNRPLSPAQAAQLTNEFERLWLAAPIGLVSLADAVSCADPFGDEARAHASYYAVQANWRLDWSILAHALGLRVTRLVRCSRDCEPVSHVLQSSLAEGAKLNPS